METTFNTSIGEYQEEDSKLLKKFRIERDEPNAYMEDCLNLHEVFDKPLSFYKNPRWRLFPMLIYPYWATFSTSLAMVFSRSLSGFAFAKSDTSNFAGIMPYIYIVWIGIFALFSYFLLNKSLKHFNTVYVVPIFKAFDLFHNIMSGGVFLREFGQYNIMEFIFFITGGSICILAILLLLVGNDKQEQSKEHEK